MKNKKAAIELSVTAIIILILAIVMLGLGLGFIRGMFGKVSSQIEQQIATEAEPAVPSASTPITLSREVIITNAGNKEIIKVSIFNPTNGTWDSAYPWITCDGLTITDQSSNKKTVEQGKFSTFNLLIGVPSVAPNTHLCQMKINDSIGLISGYEKDFAIKIIG